MLGSGNGTNPATLVRFTSTSPEIEAFFRSCLGGPEPARAEGGSSSMVSTSPPQNAPQEAPGTKAPGRRIADQAPASKAPAALSKTMAPASPEGGQNPRSAALTN